MSFAFGAFALVVGTGIGVVLRRDERGDEHRVLEPMVAGSATTGVVDARAGSTIDGRETCIGGEASTVAEAVRVTDLGEGSCSGPRPEPAQGYEDLAERVPQEQLLDLGRELCPAAMDTFEVAGEIRDDFAPSGLARQCECLRGERCEDLFGCLRGKSRRSFRDQFGDLGSASRRAARSVWDI